MTTVVGAERLGSVLRAMAEDLVIERRRVLLLRRENRQLRAELAMLGLTPDRPVIAIPEPDDPDVCPYCHQTLGADP